MKQISLFLLIIVIFTGLAACEDKASTPVLELPDIDFPEDEHNTKVMIDAPVSINSFKINDTIYLEIIVTSNDQIAFKSDFGVRIFVYDNEVWIEVDNMVITPPGFFLLSSGIDDPHNRQITAVSPNISHLNKAVTLRIFIVGNIYTDNQITNEQIVSYIDVNLTP